MNVFAGTMIALGSMSVKIQMWFFFFFPLMKSQAWLNKTITTTTKMAPFSHVHILFKGYSIFCMFTSLQNYGPCVVSNWVAAVSFKIFPFMNWEKVYLVIAKVQITCFWGLYCKDIVTKLFVLNCDSVYDRGMCYLC